MTQLSKARKEPNSYLYRISRDLSKLRIIRSAKIVIYFSSTRIMIECIARAAKELFFVCILILLVGYIYAVFGVTAFNFRTIDPDVEQPLSFPKSFDSVLDALKCMYQIFTNDHWMSVLIDTRQTSSGWIGYFYVFSWLFLGAYIFQNLATGVMVSNYQVIRQNMDAQAAKAAEEQQQHADVDDLVDKLDEEDANRISSIKPASSWHKQSSKIDRTSSGVSAGSKLSATQSMASGISIHSAASMTLGNDWQSVVEKNLMNIATDEANYYWPADTLFHYYLLMETLQENLHERHELINMLNEAVMMFNDTT